MDNSTSRFMRNERYSIGKGRMRSESKFDLYAQRKTQDTLKLSIFGLDKMHDPTYSLFKRSLWLLAMCLCFIVCLWQLYDRISYYLSHPTAIQVTLNRTCAIAFPTFTICPAISALEDPKFFADMASKSEFCVKDPKACRDITNVEFHKLGMTINDLWGKFIVTEDDVTVWTVCSSAEVKANKCYRPPNSVASQIRKRSLDTVLGRCLRVTMDVGSKYHGASTFLEIHVVRGRYQELIDQQTIAAKYYFQSDGRVNKVCGVTVEEELPMRELLVVRLQKRLFQYLNMPWKSCEDNLGMGSCIELCANALLTPQLECRLPFHNISSLKPCDTFQKAAVTLQKAASFYKQFNKAQCTCNAECKQTVYTPHITKERNIIDGNYSILWIQFSDDLVEVAAEVETYKGGDLLSDIGGSLGFFLGICVLHVLELFDELFQKGMEIFSRYMQNRRRKSSVYGTSY